MWWIRLLCFPFVFWFTYVIIMTVWNTISPGTPLKIYDKHIRPLYYTPPEITYEEEEEDEDDWEDD